MTRKTTWSNSDGLVVGFGPNTTESKAGGEVKTEGHMKEARMYIDYTTPTTASPFGIVLPAYSLISDVYVEVGTAWATSDAGKLEIGTIGGTAALFEDDFDEQAGTGGTAGNKYTLIEAALVGTGSGDRGVLYNVGSSAVRVGVTKTNNFTAGTATIVVRYL